MKDFLIATCQVLFVVLLAVGVILGITWMATSGKTYLVYTTITPFEIRKSVVGSYEEDNCQTMYNNLIDKTNYSCEGAWKFQINSLKGKYNGK